MTCTITATDTTSVAGAFNINPSIKLEVFSAGVTGTYTKTWTNAVAQAKQVKLENGECGYFSFIPIIKSIWQVIN